MKFIKEKDGVTIAVHKDEFWMVKEVVSESLGFMKKIEQLIHTISEKYNLSEKEMDGIVLEIIPDPFAIDTYHDYWLLDFIEGVKQRIGEVPEVKELRDLILQRLEREIKAGLASKPH